jgi:hypothetical protein
MAVCWWAVFMAASEGLYKLDAAAAAEKEVHK